MPFDKKKLVVLMYIGNTGTTKLVEPDDPEVAKAEVAIDLQAGTWERPGRQEKIRTYLIGGLAAGGYTSGVIGVYDRSQFGHLKVLIEEVKRAGARRR